MTLPEMALRFILSHPAVSTTIAGHAQAGARAAEYRRQRRRPARQALACGTEETSLGPHAAAAGRTSLDRDPADSSALRHCW